MREKALGRVVVTALLMPILALPAFAGDTVGLPPPGKTAEGAFPAQKHYSPFAGRNFPTQVFFGDTHLHTGMSMDAGAFGARLGPEDAYRFARGEELTSSTGQQVKLRLPLDFLVVADHSDAMGAMNEIVAGNPQLREEMQAADLRGALILGAISLICIALVVVRSIMLTHRTAGASYKIGMRLDQIAAGQHDTELHLRLKDNLRDLEEPFNKMSASLRRIAQEDAEALTNIADEIQGQENAALVERLRKLAEAKSSLTG